jgi:signal transduction histidine kinase
MEEQHENLQELLTRLNNVRDSMEEALGHVRGIEDDYRRGSLEAHIRGAIREITAQRAELVSLPSIQLDGPTARPR